MQSCTEVINSSLIEHGSERFEQIWSVFVAFYTSCRYLVVYHILRVSNISLNHCARDAIVKFFGGGVT